MASVGVIIHGASAAAGAVGAGLAQVPTTDNAIITPIQISMIIAIAKHHGKSLEEAGALALLSSLSAPIVGRAASQVMIGWIPVIGNIANASTAAGITEAIGWAANDHFSA